MSSATANGTSGHDRRKELVAELEVVVRAATSHARMSSAPINSEMTQNMCNTVEALFIHGLRDPFFLRGSRYAKYPEPNFWPFVSKFSHRAITTQISALNQIKTEIGKARAWVRVLLNEGALEHYVGLLLAEKKAVNQFYQEEAFIRDAETVEKANTLFKNLNGLPIAAPTNSSLLNTWTPTPLILAGLVQGKPVKVGTVPARRRSSGTSTPEETGICALELLPEIPSASLSPIPSYLRPTTSISLGLTVTGGTTNGHRPDESDDDASSVYSHPSMLGDSLVGMPRGSSSALFSVDASGSSPPSGDVIVHRRMKRRRNMSRSSSDGSRKSTSESGGVAAASGGNAFDRKRSANDIREGHERIAEEKESEDPHRRRRDTAADSGVESEMAATLRSIPDEKIPKMLPELHAEQETYTPAPQISTEGGAAVLSDKSEEESGEREEDKERNTGDDNVFEEDVTQEEDEESEEPIGNTGVSGASAGRPVPAEGADTSLLDEGIFSPCSNGGNSLLGRSWSAVLQQTDLSGTRLSSSSDSSREPAVVCFGQALRDQMEGGATQQMPATERSSEEEESRNMAEQRMQRKDSDEAIEEDEDVDEEEQEETDKKSRDDELAMVEKLTKIAVEAGLAAQDFRCPMCKATIAPPTYRSYSVCSFDARYYCAECWQQGAECILPARLLLNWETKPRRVSPRSRAFLESIGERALIHVDRVNGSIYDHSPAIREVKELREQLQLVAMYLFSCRESVAEDLRKRLFPKEYYVQDIHLYSYNDLVSVASGTMTRTLRILLKFAIGHVHGCRLCSQKGFICESCDAGEPVYPFQTDITHRCVNCFAVFHKACQQSAGWHCPRCKRRESYASRSRGDFDFFANGE